MGEAALTIYAIGCVVTALVVLWRIPDAHLLELIACGLLWPLFWIFAWAGDAADA